MKTLSGKTKRNAALKQIESTITTIVKWGGNRGNYSRPHAR